jgi:hypothetical protein
MDIKVKERSDAIIKRFKNVTVPFKKKADPVLNIEKTVLPDDYTPITSWSDAERLAYQYKHLGLLIVDHNDLYRLLCAAWDTHEPTIKKIINEWFENLSGEQRDEIYNKALNDLTVKTELHAKFFTRFNKNLNYDLVNSLGDVAYDNLFLFKDMYYMTNSAVVNTKNLTIKRKNSW